MIPDNVLSSKLLKSRFLSPDSMVTPTLLEDYETGGIALQDPSQGLLVQTWYGYWDSQDSTAYLVPGVDGTPIQIFTEPNVFEFSFTFDQNMRWVAVYFLVDGTCKLRWYDSQAQGYVVTVFTGLTAIKLCLDDKRRVQTNLGSSDVIFTYVTNNTLCFRQQRDRFTIEYPLQPDLPDNLRIANFGMAMNLRLQWRLKYRTFEERLPWLP